MAKIVLTIQADNKATQSVKLLNAEVQTLSKTLSTIKVNKNLTTQINALTKHYKAVADAQAKIITSKHKEALAEEKLRLEQAKTGMQIAKTNTEISKQNNLNARTEQTIYKLSKAKEKDVNATKITISQTQKLVKQYADLLNQINTLEKSYKKGTFDSVKNNIANYFNEVKNLNDVLKNGTITPEQYENKIALATIQLQGFKTEIASTRTEAKNIHGTLQDTVSGFLQFQLSAMLVMKPLQLLRDALQSINETLVKTEDAVIALQRVLPNGSATDGEISSSLYKIAQDYGQTFDNVSQIAQNFARTGMSWADTIKATEAAVLALNVAELDAEEATTGLVAVLSQFGLEASDLEGVIDKLNKTADNFPVTTEKILAALQRTGSAAANANLNLDQTISLITALSKATGRSGENLGTALNSLIQYSSKATALDTFANLSEESANIVAQYRQGGKTILDVWQQVSKEIKNLKSEQADLLDGYFATEDGKALSDALDGELEDIYTELQGVYDTANTFRKNYFIALLGNMDTVEQAMGTIQGAQGYSQAENQKYLDTYTAKLNTLKAQWEDIANSEQGLLGIKKFFVDIASILLNIVQHTGGLRTTLIALSTIVWQLVGTKIISGFQSVIASIKSLTTGLRTATTAAEGLQAALGPIGAIATLVSVIIGIIESVDADRQNNFVEQVSNAESSLNDLSDSLAKLDEQYTGYIKTITDTRNVIDNETSSTNELNKARSSLVQLQSDLIRNNKNYEGSLDLVNGSLEEQLAKVKELEEFNARSKVSKWLDENADATYGAKEYLNTTGLSYIFDEYSDPYGNGNTLLLKYLQSKGYNAYADITDEGVWENIKNSFGALFGSDTLRTQLYIDEFTREDYVSLFEELIKDLDNSDYTDEERDYIKAQLTSAINYYRKGDYQQRYNLIHGNANSTSWVERLSQEQRIQFAKGELSWEEIQQILGLIKDGTDTTKKWHNNISKVEDKYDDLIGKLEELRDLNKEAYDWEEKKLAVLEAEQALENARNEATVRRFNKATGLWEWQTDEKAIQEAEENLEKARLELEESAYDTIIKQLEDKTATNEGIKDILNEVAPLLGESFAQSVKDAIFQKTEVDLDKPIYAPVTKGNANLPLKPNHSDKHYVKLEAYDSGGVANGLGFMPKATAQPESVNDPELTRKILSPVSNAEFNRYVRDMGIMFERSHEYAQMPVIERVGGNTDNRVDNSGQITMNGVTIGSDKRGSTLDELLTLASIIPN